MPLLLHLVHLWLLFRTIYPIAMPRGQNSNNYSTLNTNIFQKERALEKKIQFYVKLITSRNLYLSGTERALSQVLDAICRGTETAKKKVKLCSNHQKLSAKERSLFGMRHEINDFSQMDRHHLPSTSQGQQVWQSRACALLKASHWYLQGSTAGLHIPGQNPFGWDYLPDLVGDLFH